MAREGDPAYPVAESHDIAAQFEWTAGMTMRQWYKGMALQGLLARTDDPSEGETMEPLSVALSSDHWHSAAQWTAIRAARIADAMLAEDAQHEDQRNE